MPVITETTVDVAPEVAFAFICDLSKWSEFRGYGPLPGIVSATLPDGEVVRLGARIRVTNTDGSVHHEVVEEFEPARRYRVRMEPGPPASSVLARIDETVELAQEGAGTRIRRTFVLTPRSPLTAPIAWVAAFLLRRAVLRHDLAVATALRRTPDRPV